MDGLECSEIRVNDIDKKLFRIEAEFFNKEYRRVEALLKKYDKMKVYAKKIECGPFGSNLLDTDYVDKGILVVRPFNLINATIEDERLVYISEKTIARNGLKKYPKNTVLFSRVGDIKVGYANRGNFTISPNIVVLELNKEELAKYFALFFNTYYGKVQIHRQLKVASQPTISTDIISELRVPMFNSIMPIIVHCVNLAETYLSKANKLYIDAEELLLTELGMKDFALTEEIFSVRTLSESFGETGRIDAEYYQPKYEFYESKIKNYCGGYNKLGDICKYIFTGEYADEYLRKSKNLQFYIRGTNMKNGRIEKDDNYYVHPGSFTKKVCSGDIVTTRVGTIGTFAEIDDNLDGAVYSDNVICFRMPDECRADVYTLLFNSKPVYEIIDRLARGSVQQRLNQETLRQIIVPMLDLDLQRKISEIIQSSFELRNKSRLLLNCAVQAVEMAIEQSEEKATTWLSEKVKEVESL